jgi:hypothetical protein
MSRRLISTFAVLLLAAFAGVAAGQTVDDVISKNLQARGGADVLRGVQTLEMRAHLSSQGINLPMTLYAKRPNLTRKELSVVGQTLLFVFDGTNAWQVNPLQGSTEPVDIRGGELDRIRQESDFDTPLLDARARGFTVELAGNETVDGRVMQHLRVARNGTTLDCYLDAVTGLEARTVSRTPMGALTQEFLDYRNVQGVQMPFTVRTLQNGVRVAEITFDAIRLNAPLEEGLFNKPVR